MDLSVYIENFHFQVIFFSLYVVRYLYLYIDPLRVTSRGARGEPHCTGGQLELFSIEVVHMMSNDVIKMQKLINYTYIVL